MYVVDKYEAKFFTERIKIFKRTWIKCLLETTLTFSVKPTTILCHKENDQATVFPVWIT